MKKIIAAVVCVLLVAMLLAGCSSSNQSQQQQQQQQPQKQQQAQPSQETLKDGVYYAEAKDFDDHGWKPMATVIVKDGKITNVFFDYINKDGKLKTFDAEYAKNMKAKTNTTPLDAATALANSLISKQKVDEVDAVTGATHTVQDFKTIVAEALKNPVTSQGQYKDGLYKAIEKEFDDHGWKAMVAVIVKDGKISSVFWDEINKDDNTNYKLSNADYAKNMEAQTKMTPTKAYEALSKSLIEKQDPAAVDKVTGATHTTEKFKTMVSEALSFAK